MRVIAGSARRTQLKTLEGMDTRPTTDRIKETLFNMIAPYLYDSIFLDLFAGSGGIGIEVSGNVTKENIARLTGLGVDYVSSGALTHSAPILDISLKNLHPVEN